MRHLCAPASPDSRHGFRMSRIIKLFAIPIAAMFVLSGCVLAPKGTKEEQSAAREGGRAYAQPFEQRALPDLPSNPSWQDVLRRAFLANGDLEAAYFEWKAALARIPQVANYPNTNLAPSFSYMFSPGRMKTFDRTTTNIGFDPMQTLSFPTKVTGAGKITLEQAKLAGERVEGMKFEVQRKVFTGDL